MYSNLNDFKRKEVCVNAVEHAGMKTLSILIIEDNQQRTDFLVGKLIGHNVQVIKDPLAAVECLSHDKCDLIFLDYDLTSVPSSRLIENGTGIYVAKRLPETINKSTPVVVHSMNIKAAEYMTKIMDRSLMIPFHRLREELEKDGAAAFLQRIMKED